MDRRFLLLISVAIAIVLPGCSSGSQASHHESLTQAASHAQTAKAPVAVHAKSKTEITGSDARSSIAYPGTGALLEAPGAASPVLTAAQALKLCSTPHYGVSCEAGPPASATLGKLADAGMGIDDELVWALTWTSVNCELMGPVNRPAPGPLVNDATGCDFVTFINATSGSNPETVRGPFGL